MSDKASWTRQTAASRGCYREQRHHMMDNGGRSMLVISCKPGHMCCIGLGVGAELSHMVKLRMAFSTEVRCLKQLHYDWETGWAPYLLKRHIGIKPSFLAARLVTCSWLTMSDAPSNTHTSATYEYGRNRGSR